MIRRRPFPVLARAALAAALLSPTSTAQEPQPVMGEPVPGLTAAEQILFQAGLGAFSAPLSPAEGAGPIFNEVSSAGCHTVPAIGGFGTRDLDGPLPVLAGEGANLAVPEALSLIVTAAPLGDRLHGLVRMGERRWDVVLTDGSRILLPATGADAALNRVLALHDVGEILSRDVTAVDLRNPARLTVRLTEPALDELRRIRALWPTLNSGEPNG